MLAQFFCNQTLIYAREWKEINVWFQIIMFLLNNLPWYSIDIVSSYNNVDDDTNIHTQNGWKLLVKSGDLRGLNRVQQF